MEFKRMMIQHKTELWVNHIQEAIVFVLVSAPPEGNLKPRRFLRLIIFISTLILAFAKTSACRNTEDPEETFIDQIEQRYYLLIYLNVHAIRRIEH